VTSGEMTQPSKVSVGADDGGRDWGGEGVTGRLQKAGNTT
jgi:hypothetical protein